MPEVPIDEEKWYTVAEVAKLAGVTRHTARAHAVRLKDEGFETRTEERRVGSRAVLKGVLTISGSAVKKIVERANARKASKTIRRGAGEYSLSAIWNRLPKRNAQGQENAPTPAEKKFRYSVDDYHGLLQFVEGAGITKKIGGVWYVSSTGWRKAFEYLNSLQTHYTPQEAARLLAVSTNTLSHMARDGEIKQFRLGVLRPIYHKDEVLQAFRRRFWRREQPNLLPKFEEEINNNMLNANAKLDAADARVLARFFRRTTTNSLSEEDVARLHNIVQFVAKIVQQRKGGSKHKTAMSLIGQFVHNYAERTWDSPQTFLREFSSLHTQIQKLR